MENFWSTLKTELVNRRSWRTRDEAENAIFAYIDAWYNTERIQKDLRGKPMSSTGRSWCPGVPCTTPRRRAQ
jgi:putative transposase